MFLKDDIDIDIFKNGLINIYIIKGDIIDINIFKKRRYIYNWYGNISSTTGLCPSFLSEWHYPKQFCGRGKLSWVEKSSFKWGGPVGKSQQNLNWNGPTISPRVELVSKLNKSLRNCPNIANFSSCCLASTIWMQNICFAFNHTSPTIEFSNEPALLVFETTYLVQYLFAGGAGVEASILFRLDIPRDQLLHKLSRSNLGHRVLLRTCTWIGYFTYVKKCDFETN